jgi:hypothetical protein
VIGGGGAGIGEPSLKELSPVGLGPAFCGLPPAAEFGFFTLNTDIGFYKIWRVGAWRLSKKSIYKFNLICHLILKITS